MEETIEAWKKVQDDLKQLVITVNFESWEMALDFDTKHLSNLKIPNDLKLIAGLDISFDKTIKDLACVCIAVVDLRSNKLVGKHNKIVTMTEPYVANYLAFRECEHMVAVVKEYLDLFPALRPQVLLVDGNGTCHSNRFGSACHLGVRLMQEGITMPTIGVAKKYLQIDGMPTREEIISQVVARGKDGSEVLHDVIHPRTGEIVCTVRRMPRKGKAVERDTEERGKLAFISPGHMISQITAVNIVRLCSKCRVPEPILLADHYAKDVLIKHKKEHSLITLRQDPILSDD